MTLSIERARTGRRARGGPCRPRARRGRRCLVWSQVRRLTAPAAAGPNAIRLRARGLRPGRHRLWLSAEDGVGNDSVPRSLRLRVVRLRPRR